MQLHSLGSGVNMGHLPAAVSKHLAPLLDDGIITAEVTASSQDLCTSTGPVPLHLRLKLAVAQDDASRGSSSPHSSSSNSSRSGVDSSAMGSDSNNQEARNTAASEARVLAALQAARAAQLQQRSGAVLCNNFNLVLEHVRWGRSPC